MTVISRKESLEINPSLGLDSVVGGVEVFRPSASQTTSDYIKRFIIWASSVYTTAEGSMNKD